MRVLCLLFKPPVSLREIAQACFRFTSQIALREPEAIFLEIEKSFRLYSEHNLLLRTQVLLKHWKLPALVCIANDPPTAMAWARYGSGGPAVKSLLPLEALQDYASPFVEDCHVRGKVNQIIFYLKKLGLKSLADFQQLSPRTLSPRFGQQALLLSQRVRHCEDLPWPRFQEPQSIVEAADVEELRVCNIEALFFTLNDLIRRILSRLRGIGVQLLSLELKLSFCKHRPRVWTITFPLPQGSASGVLMILRERLNFDLAREPLTEPLQSLAVTVLDVCSAYDAQRDFFSKKTQQMENWNSLVARLVEKLGPSRVFLAEPVPRHLPEASWKKTSWVFMPNAVMPEKITRTLERPSRLLKKPVRLVKEENRLSSGECSWTCLEWRGPERISGEWWEQGFERDYFQILTETGQRLWVFLDPQKYWYLHGYFD